MQSASHQALSRFAWSNSCTLVLRNALLPWLKFQSLGDVIELFRRYWKVVPVLLGERHGIAVHGYNILTSVVRHLDCNLSCAHPGAPDLSRIYVPATNALSGYSATDAWNGALHRRQDHTNAPIS